MGEGVASLCRLVQIDISSIKELEMAQLAKECSGPQDGEEYETQKPRMKGFQISRIPIIGKRTNSPG
eukprot:Skav207602  [mRNA]  locus=scaffold2450:190135:190335:+ [translate_table: standard]